MLIQRQVGSGLPLCAISTWSSSRPERIRCLLIVEFAHNGRPDPIRLGRMKKAELVLQTQTDALLRENGLLISPRPTVDRDKLEDSLRDALRLLHVDLDDENLRDTPRRWAESMITLT